MVKRCAWGLCNSDSRYPERDPGVFFIPFPKPRRKKDKCLLWIGLCGRPHWQLNISTINRHTYMCSKHFVDGAPSDRFPNPVDAAGTGTAAKPCRPDRKRSRSRKSLDPQREGCTGETSTESSMLENAGEAIVMTTENAEEAMTMTENAGEIIAENNGPQLWICLSGCLSRIVKGQPILGETWRPRKQHPVGD